MNDEELDRIVLQAKYARIIRLVAQKMGITYEKAMDLFYRSVTFQLISGKVADLHCRSDEYLRDELIIELSASERS